MKKNKNKIKQNKNLTYQNKQKIVLKLFKVT